MSSCSSSSALARCAREPPQGTRCWDLSFCLCRQKPAKPSGILDAFSQVIQHSKPYLASMESFATCSKCQYSPHCHWLRVFGIKNPCRVLVLKYQWNSLWKCLTVVAHGASSSSKLSLSETCFSECTLTVGYLGSSFSPSSKVSLVWPAR